MGFQRRGMREKGRDPDSDLVMRAPRPGAGLSFVAI
jgi:hypothetical protein